MKFHFTGIGREPRTPFVAKLRIGQWRVGFERKFQELWCENRWGNVIKLVGTFDAQEGDIIETSGRKGAKSDVHVLHRGELRWLGSWSGALSGKINEYLQGNLTAIDLLPPEDPRKWYQKPMLRKVGQP